MLLAIAQPARLSREVAVALQKLQLVAIPVVEPKTDAGCRELIAQRKAGLQKILAAERVQVGVRKQLLKGSPRRLGQLRRHNHRADRRDLLAGVSEAGQHGRGDRRAGGLMIGAPLDKAKIMVLGRRSR